MGSQSAWPVKPGVLIGFGVVVILGAAYFLMQRVQGDGSRGQVVNYGNYYTADEGQTYVPDVWSLIPPFDRDRKTWLRVYLFTTDGKTPLPERYLEKYTLETQAELLAAEEPHIQIARMNELGDHGLLVKRPGDANWVPKDGPEAAAIITVLGPDGKPARPLVPEIPKSH